MWLALLHKIIREVNLAPFPCHQAVEFGASESREVNTYATNALTLILFGLTASRNV